MYRIPRPPAPLWGASLGFAYQIFDKGWGFLVTVNKQIEPGEPVNIIFQSRAFMGGLKEESDIGEESREISELENKLAKQPGNAMLWVKKGDLLIGLNRNEEAMESFDRALAVEPGMAAAANGKDIAIGRIRAASGEGKAVPKQTGENEPENAGPEKMGKTDEAKVSIQGRQGFAVDGAVENSSVKPDDAAVKEALSELEKDLESAKAGETDFLSVPDSAMGEEKTAQSELLNMIDRVTEGIDTGAAEEKKEEADALNELESEITSMAPALAREGKGIETQSAFDSRKAKPGTGGTSSGTGNTDGITNGSHRLTGKINGTGRILGILNGRKITGELKGKGGRFETPGKINGHVNGFGRINGLINGRRRLSGFINSGGRVEGDGGDGGLAESGSEAAGGQVIHWTDMNRTGK